jgi:YVTN family beta-propeller protein
MPRNPRRLFLTATITTVIAALTGVAVGAGSWSTAHVGSDDGRGILLPDQQRITPAGVRHLVTNGRLLSSTLSPDGTKLAALTFELSPGFLTIMDVKSGAIVQQVGLGQGGQLGDGTVAADGPLYSPDGKSLWFPQSSDLLRFAVTKHGLVNPVPTSIPLTDPKSGAADLPSGMATSADGSLLYVALNGANALGVIDTATNQLIKRIPVGNAPRQVVLVGHTAYVSNEGGRPAHAGDFTNLSDGTPLVANKSTGAAKTGTVSVVDLARGRQARTISVGLQPTAEYLGHDGTLFVANSNDDSVSLIDTASNQVVQTINVNPLPGSTVGSYPNAMTMSGPHTLLVSIGRDNAIAEYRYDGARKPLQYRGLIPTDWYPVNVQYDAAVHRVVVTNDKGIGSRGPAGLVSKPLGGKTVGSNTYLDTGSVTEFRVPSDKTLSADTHKVFVDNAWDQLLARNSSRSSARLTPVPTQAGQRSPIKHVFLIVKENRTYDQVFGDMGKGNSDPAFSEFGRSITPNQHQLAGDFGLFDNFYDEGTLSADGHNWLMQADANDYIEKEFGAFYRSYPAQGGDALAYQRDGFLWNAAAKAGRTARDFGEYNNFITLPSTPPTWSQWYHDSQVLEGKATGPLNTPLGTAPTYADIPSLNTIDDHDYPMFDLDVPDQYRYAIWNRSFRQSVKTGNLAALNMLWVPDDHTSGSPTDPSPVAEVADNDLAVGRIVDTISHSRFWSSSAIFVVEDDPQEGVDHVDGHRSTFLLLSPYAKRGIVDSTYYTQLNVVRTIEAILGIEPMNQEDRAAVPMSDAFTNQPDLRPCDHLTNEIPLNLGLDPTQAGFDPTAGAPAGGAVASRSLTAAPPGRMQAVVRAWQAWGEQQHFGGRQPIPDYANPRLLNRYDYYFATGWTRPYPGDDAILLPTEVPGWWVPSAYLGDR